MIKKLATFLMCFVAWQVHAQIVESMLSIPNTFLSNAGHISSITYDPTGFAYFACGHHEITIMGDPVEMGISICKLNASNQIIWHTDLNGFAFNTSGQLGIDEIGNFYLTGKFKDSLVIGDTTLLSQPAGWTGFVLKLDHQGGFQWAKTFGDVYNPKFELRSDNGIVVIVGVIGTFYSENDTLINSCGSSGAPVLIRSYGPDGSLDWSRNFNCVGSGLNFSIDNNGATHWAGDFRDTLFMADSLLFGAFPSSKYAFWMSLDSTGELQSFHSIDAITEMLPTHIVIDPLGNKIITGRFVGNQDFGGITVASSLYDLFLAKYTPTDSLLWVTAAGQTFTTPSKLAINDANEIFVTGASETFTFGGTVLTSISGGYDLFLLKFDSNGAPVWGVMGGGPGIAYDLTLTPQGNVCVAAEFSGAGSMGGIPIDIPFNQVGFLINVLDGFNLIQGEVFSDLNGNGVRDPGEQLKDEVILRVMPDSNYFRSNSTTGYQAFTQTGTKTLEIPQLPLYHTLSTALPTVTFTGIGEVDSMNNVGLAPIPNIVDAGISMVDITPFRPGFSAHTLLTFFNQGTDTVNGTIQFSHDTTLSFDSATVVPDLISGDTLFWNYTNLLPGESRQIELFQTLAPWTPILTELCLHGAISTIIPDTNLANNMDTLQPVVTGAYDPNDKQVFPDSALDISFIGSGQPLKYTIRFQNTGNDTAFTVIVKDTLNPMLDQGTFSMIGASHPYELLMGSSGELEWRFDQILLPDSNVNESASHGALSFNIEPWTTLAPGDTITNRASIYFDYNAPILTNTVVSYIAFLVENEPSTTLSNSELKLYPNPSHTLSYLEYVAPERGTAEISITDATGKETFHKLVQLTPGINRIPIPLAEVNLGVSILHFNSPTYSHSHKIIKY